MRHLILMAITVGLLGLAAAPLDAGAAAPPSGTEHRRTNEIDAKPGSPAMRMQEACKKLCTGAHTANEMSRCVASRETLQGSTSFKLANPDCYNAHQEYQAFLERRGPERYG